MGSAMSTPYVISFADATHGFAARANDLEDGAAYVYTTADAGGRRGADAPLLLTPEEAARV